MAQSSFEILTPLADDIPDAPDLDQRLEKLSDVDKRIQDLLLTAKEILAGYDRERQNAKAKMDTIHKRYEDNVEAIHSGISEQLVYMERMCVGAEHQGSTFAIQQQSELMRNRTESLLNDFGRVADLASHHRADSTENSVLAADGATTTSALALLKSLELTEDDDALIEAAFSDPSASEANNVVGVGDEQSADADQTAMEVHYDGSAGSASRCSSVQMEEDAGDNFANNNADGDDDEDGDENQGDRHGGGVEEVEIDSDN